MFKTLNQTLMKKAIIAASAAIILAAGAATCWTVFGGNEDEFFNENLEALMDRRSSSGISVWSGLILSARHLAKF